MHSGARRMIALSMWMVAGLAGMGQAQAQAVGPVAQQQQGVVVEEEERSWHVGGALTSRVGQGSFVALRQDSGVPARDDTYARWMLAGSLWGSYAPHEEVTLSASGALTQWLSAGGGINEPYELRLQDVQLGATWMGRELGASGVHVTAGLGLGLPTSKVSRAQTMILDTSAWAQVSRRFFGRLWLGYTMSGGKTFHQYTSAVISAQEVGQGNALYRSGGAEDLGGGLVALDGVNTELAWSNGLAARFGIWGPLSAQAAYTLISYWTYDVGRDDALKSPYADSGRGHAQLSSATLALRADVLPQLAITAGASTVMAPRSDDNASLRFPFWGTSGAARNQSQVFLSLSSVY